MNRLLRNIIILVAVLAVLAGGFWWLLSYEPSVDTEQDSVSSETTAVYTVDKEEIEAVTVKGGETLTFRKNGDVLVIDGYSTESISTSKTSSLISAVTYISAGKPVSAALEECGLNTPSAVVTVKRTDGGEDTIKIGSKSAVLGEYFFNVNDGEIYTMSSYKAESILNGIGYYTEFSRLEINSQEVFDITIERAKNTLQIKQNTNADILSSWMISKPFKREYSANDDYVKNHILSLLDTIDLSTPADVSVNSPKATVTILSAPLTDSGERSEEVTKTVLKVGNTEGETIYVEYNGEVFAADKAAFEFVDTDEFVAVSKMLSLINISTLNRLTITAVDKLYSFDVRHTAIGEAGDEMTFIINERAASEDKAKKAYQEVIALPAEGRYNGEALGEKIVELKFESEGGTKTMSFNKINDLSASYTVDGLTEFTVKLSTLNSMLEKIAEFAENPA